MAVTRDHEWLNSNALRAYPLAEESSHLASSYPVTGPTSIPTDLLVDLKLLVPVSTSYPYRISAISFTGALLALTVSDDADLPLAGVTVNTATLSSFSEVELSPLFAGVSGVAVFGPGISTVFNSWIPGKYKFDFDGAGLEATVAIPYQAGQVTSLGDQKESRDPEAIVVGDVSIIPGVNIQARYDSGTNSIILSLVDTGPFVPLCEQGCTLGACISGSILRVAGVTPNERGEICIEGANGVEIGSKYGAITIGHSLKWEDFCPKYTRAPRGEPGPPGTQGLPGPDGTCVCGTCDLLVPPGGGT